MQAESSSVYPKAANETNPIDVPAIAQARRMAAEAPGAARLMSRQQWPLWVWGCGRHLSPHTPVKPPLIHSGSAGFFV